MMTKDHDNRYDDETCSNVDDRYIGVILMRVIIMIVTTK